MNRQNDLRFLVQNTETKIQIGGGLKMEIENYRECNG